MPQDKGFQTKVNMMASVDNSGSVISRHQLSGAYAISKKTFGQMGQSVQISNKQTYVPRPPIDVARTSQVYMKMPWQKAKKEEVPKVDVTDSFKIEGDNIKEIKEDFQETASPTKAPQSKPFARKSTLFASFRVWFPFANLPIGNITKPFIGGLNSFWWPRINLVLRG